MTALPRFSQSPTDPEFVQDPYPLYDAMRAAGPLVFWEDYGLPVAAGYAQVSALLRDRRLGRLVPDPPPVPPHLEPFYAIENNSMLELEPPRHTRLRGLVLRAFTRARIAALAPQIETLCHELIDAFPSGPVDLLPHYCAQVPVIVIARLLGVPEAMAPQLLAWSNAIVAMYQARRDRAVEEAAATASAAFAKTLRAYIDRRRTEPGDDLITHLIAAEAEGDRLSHDELIATCILLLNAGHEATVHTMGNGIAALLATEAPAAWLDPGAVEATVDEILRYDPPLHMFTRYAYEETEVFGHVLHRGDRVGCLLGAAGRDPAMYDRPDFFDPTRTQHPPLAFGAGLHFCVGAPLARLELQIALRVLFERLPQMRLAERPRYANLYHFHGLQALRVTP